MTADIREIFNEIRRIQYSETDENDRYRALDRLLTRCIKSLTQDYPVDFTHVATRLHWLCKSNRHPSYPLEVFRARAYRIRLGHEHAETDNYPYDLKAVCEGLAAFYHTDIPDDLHKILPHHWRSISSDAASPHALRIRLTVHHWDRRFIYGQDNAHPTKQELRVSYISESDPTFADLYTQLYEGAQLNLLSVRILETPEPEHREYPCTLYPDILILDPDFLVDITSIFACMKPYGHSPYTYLLNKFFPSVRSATLQLGNVANQFLDDCVNENGDGMTEDSLYLRSMQKSFRLSPLTYSTLPGIDSCFFDQCREQFRNIRRTVSHSFSAAAIDSRQSEVVLDPCFV
ncbi:MAG: ATP-dependent helicase, partial [Paraprevotella sp.]|nr:ATP-dependent helicase [Paraprevotella sp.]